MAKHPKKGPKSPFRPFKTSKNGPIWPENVKKWQKPKNGKKCKGFRPWGVRNPSKLKNHQNGGFEKGGKNKFTRILDPPGPKSLALFSKIQKMTILTLFWQKMTFFAIFGPFFDPFWTQKWPLFDPFLTPFWTPLRPHFGVLPVLCGPRVGESGLGAKLDPKMGYPQIGTPSEGVKKGAFSSFHW